MPGFNRLCLLIAVLTPPATICQALFYIPLVIKMFPQKPSAIETIFRQQLYNTAQRRS
jgi:hypothetical protein